MDNTKQYALKTVLTFLLAMLFSISKAQKPLPLPDYSFINDSPMCGYREYMPGIMRYVVENSGNYTEKIGKATRIDSVYYPCDDPPPLDSAGNVDASTFYWHHKEKRKNILQRYTVDIDYKAGDTGPYNIRFEALKP